MMRESPIRTSACMIFPSGPVARATSSAPSAFLYQSIACAALSSVSCGVTVWYPSGTALFAVAIATSFDCGHEAPILRSHDAPRKLRRRYSQFAWHCAMVGRSSKVVFMIAPDFEYRLYDGALGGTSTLSLVMTYIDTSLALAGLTLNSKSPLKPQLQAFFGDSLSQFGVDLETLDPSLRFPRIEAPLVSGGYAVGP